jgi:hypothetical protein
VEQENITVEEIREEVPCGICLTTIRKDADGNVISKDVQIIVDAAKVNFGLGSGTGL